MLDTPRLRRWRDRAADLFFPPRCAVCAAAGALLCDACRRDFPPAAGPRCRRCWTPAGPGTVPTAGPGAGDALLCDRCRINPPPLASLRTPFVFEATLRRALLAVKYQGLTATAAPILDAAARNAATPVAIPDGIELVTAVPMAGRRRRRRGHNQAALFAALLAARAALPFDERALRRRRSTPQQAKQPSLDARHANVLGAFTAEPARVRDRAVLVVDDVTTSGATLNACADALLQAGATIVHGWAVARED